VSPPRAGVGPSGGASSWAKPYAGAEGLRRGQDAEAPTALFVCTGPFSHSRHGHEDEDRRADCPHNGGERDVREAQCKRPMVGGQGDDGPVASRRTA
jgi:hypothetical protein